MRYSLLVVGALAVLVLLSTCKGRLIVDFIYDPDPPQQVASPWLNR